MRWVRPVRHDLIMSAIKKSPYVLENNMCGSAEMIRVHIDLWGLDERFVRARVREYCSRFKGYEGPVEGLSDSMVFGKVLMRIETYFGGKML